MFNAGYLVFDYAWSVMHSNQRREMSTLQSNIGDFMHGWIAIALINVKTYVPAYYQ